uniref:Uncharacterized protein n=1 Tax=Spironucleus salmonicida TaxID=348837 RepID=V6LLX0_9EUKA|eukprot:EST45208.1 Hypothetical protein SS50377_14780 [Spironucleus salmonicida]
MKDQSIENIQDRLKLLKNMQQRLNHTSEYTNINQNQKIQTYELQNSEISEQDLQVLSTSFIKKFDLMNYEQDDIFIEIYNKNMSHYTFLQSQLNSILLEIAFKLDTTLNLCNLDIQNNFLNFLEVMTGDILISIDISQKIYSNENYLLIQTWLGGQIHDKEKAIIIEQNANELIIVCKDVDYEIIKKILNIK